MSLKRQKILLDSGIYLVIDQLTKKNILNFNAWDILTFLSGDMAQRFGRELPGPGKWLSDELDRLGLPYHNILERVFVIELFRVLWVALSKAKSTLTPINVLKDFSKLSFSLTLSDSLYPILESSGSGDSGSSWWEDLLAGATLGASSTLVSSGEELLVVSKISERFLENGLLLGLSGLAWLLLSSEGRRLVSKSASASKEHLDQALQFAPLLLL